MQQGKTRETFRETRTVIVTGNTSVPPNAQVSTEVAGLNALLFILGAAPIVEISLTKYMSEGRSSAASLLVLPLDKTQ